MLPAYRRCSSRKVLRLHREMGHLIMADTILRTLPAPERERTRSLSLEIQLEYAQILNEKVQVSRKVECSY